MMTASEKEISLDPDGTAVDRPDCGEEIKENVRMGIPSPAKLFGTEMATPSEKTSRRAKAASLETAGGVLENKAMARQKKREVAKTGVVSKVQKKKEKRPSHAEPVVGKSRPKRAVGKTVAYSKENSSHVKRSEAAEEPNQEKEKEGGSVELEPLDSLAEGDRGVKLNEDADEKEEKDGLRSPSDQSLPPSSPPEEEQPFLFGGRHPFTEDVAHTSASPAGPTDGPPLLRPPATSPSNGSQSDAVWSSGPAEDLPVNKAEGKQSRERIIMERAEKRRLAVERKRREQEELKRKEQEKQEREERMREEMEQERQRRVEEMRLKKLQLEEERQRQEEEAARRRYAEKAAEERVRQQQEEHRRKLLEMQKKKREEEQARAEAEKLRQKEREMWLKEEQQRIAEMAEEQRLEYEKRKQEEAEKAKCEAEERRKREEEEARIALEEAKKQALLLARQRAELEKQQQFQYKLLVEASGLERGQVISRPWVYSYFQLPFIKVGDDD